MVNNREILDSRLTVFLAIRNRRDLLHCDRTLFSLGMERRFLPIQIIALVASALKDEVSQLISIARKHRFTEHDFRYLTIPEPSLLKSIPFLGDWEPSAFLLLDSNRIIYPGTAKKLFDALNTARQDRLDAIFGGARVSRCDFNRGQFVTSKDPLFLDAKDIGDLVRSPTFLDYGCGIYSAGFFRENRETLIRCLSELNFDSILKTVLARNTFQLDFFSVPVIELYVDQLDPHLAPLSFIQLQLAEHQRTIQSLQYELNRLRDENFNLATDRNLLIQQKEREKGFKKIKNKLSRVKSVIKSLTQENHVN